MLESKGILENKYSEFGLFFFPGILAFLFLWGLPEQWSGQLWLVVVAYYFSDAGHVFTTILRYDFKSKADYKEVLYPLAIFSTVFFTCFAFRINEVWHAIVYLTFVHNLKQAYGISAWYRMLGREERKTPNTFKFLFYTLNLLALAALHFRPKPGVLKEYPLLFVFRYESEVLFYGTLLLYFVGMLFLIRERLKNAKTREAFAFPFVMCSVYFVSFVFSKNSHQILIPLILTHGLAYMGMISHSSKRLFDSSKVPIIIGIGIAGGLADWLFLEEMVFQKYNVIVHHFFRAIVFGAIFTHYYLDGFLWRREHPQIPQISAASD